MVHYPLNLALLFQMSDGYAGKATVDLQSFNDDALADELERGDFLQDAIVCCLVERDSVLGLVFDFAL
jgi:hypothetical protein